MIVDLRAFRFSVAALVVIGLSSSAVEAFAQQALKPRLEGEALISALREGGLVILMRHMSTDDYVPGNGAHVDADCTTQRNLDDHGRDEAKTMGEAIAKLGIPIGPVLSSPYCRCVQTATLAFGAALPVPELAVFDALEASEKEARGKAIRARLNERPTEGENVVLVTHTGTLLYTFGLQTRPEGIAHVFRPAEFGNAIYLGRVLPEEWRSLAAKATP